MIAVRQPPAGIFFATAEPLHSPPLGHVRGTVLVVDDDASLRFLCRVNLELEGYRVLEAATVAEGRAALAREPVAALLLDLHVGGDSGLALLDDLDARSGTRPGVAFFTGAAAIDDAVRARGDAVISKPFSLEDLAQTVERLVIRGS
jgi:DNA-binding NtrC family response regulator